MCVCVCVCVARETSEGPRAPNEGLRAGARAFSSVPLEDGILFVGLVVGHFEEGDLGFVADALRRQRRAVAQNQPLVVVPVDARVVGLGAVGLVLDLHGTRERERERKKRQPKKNRNKQKEVPVSHLRFSGSAANLSTLDDARGNALILTAVVGVQLVLISGHN